jgi:hypothetical protein
MNYFEIPHLKLNIKLPIECAEELLKIEDFYGLRLENTIREETKLRYFNSSSGHALRSYKPDKKLAYFTKGSKSLWVEEPFLEDHYEATESWKKYKNTTTWLIENLCDEEDLGMVALHKLSSNGSVDYHSHGDVYPYTMGIVHFSLKTNENDMSCVRNKFGDEIEKNYPLHEGYLFNGMLQHKSYNTGKDERIHLVVECKFSNLKFSNILKNAIHCLHT